MKALHRARMIAGYPEPVRIGVNVPNAGPGTEPRHAAQLGADGRGLGFDLLMVSDHIAVTPDVAEQRYPAPFCEATPPTLAWLAGITSRVRLGTTVLIVPYRHPLLIARMTFASDGAQRGSQLVLDVGVGWTRQEFSALGSRSPSAGSD